MRVSLNGSGWRIKPFLDEEWRRADALSQAAGWIPATVSGSIHYDLWQVGQIPDPYFERNTLLIEWVAERCWVYQCTFRTKALGKRAHLVFEGVDYAAEFFLNGESLGTHRSQFAPAIFEVTDKLKYDGENELVVVLQPAPREQSQMGRTSLVRVHRTRMNEGWDFCPRLRHLGLWQGVYLDWTGAARIEDVWVRPRLSDDFVHADVQVSVTLEAHQQSAVRVEARLLPPDSDSTSKLQSQTVPVHGSQTVEFAFSLPNPQLWYPNGHGDQPLYECEVRIFDTDGESDSRCVSFGLRKIEWAHNLDRDTGQPRSDALPYTMVVNGRRTYIHGWNWVPIDLLYGVQRPDKLEHLLALARDAHCNLLRCNGVGLIETEAFYNLCDRYGIMIWQEFIQSSSATDRKPASDSDYLHHLTREAEAIIPQKRNHPSLVIWCGGNELEGLDFLPLDDRESAIATLKAAVERLDPDRLWLPTSASGPMPFCGINNATNNPLIMHDVHGPWHHQGLTGQYTLFNRSRSLLHSEFGAEGLTNLETLRQVMHEANLSIAELDNLTWRHLGASWWVKRDAWRAMLGEVDSFEALVLATQQLQAEAVKYAIEANRRRLWESSGSLPWMFNEPYPMAANTSAVDYYGRPKPLYEAVKCAYEPLHVSAQFDTQTWADKDEFTTGIWVTNTSNRALSEEAAVSAVLVRHDSSRIAKLTLPAAVGIDQSVPLGHFTVPLLGIKGMFWLRLELCDENGQIVSRNQYRFTRAETV
jgi:beta-mannosidase